MQKNDSQLPHVLFATQVARRISKLCNYKMRRSYNDDEAEWLANNQEFAETDECDDALEEDIAYDYTEDEQPKLDEDIRDPTIKPLEWTAMKFDEDIYMVSTEGHIRNTKHDLFAVTAGYRVEGTPYREVVVRTQDAANRIYIHDLVWRAFNGDVPSGWAVRHSDLTVDYENCYSNHIDNLRIVKQPAPNMFSDN